MKRIVIPLTLLTVIACNIASAQGIHPRLWFGPGDTMAIRIKATTQGTTAYDLWQVLKLRQADHYSQTGPPDRRLQIVNNPGEYPNLYSLAFAYMITRNQLYQTRAREIIFGWNGPNGLLTQPFTGDGDTRVLALSIVTDLLWDNFTPAERTQILQVVHSDISLPDIGLRASLSKPDLIHDNNHQARKARALLPAAIVFNGDALYPEANTDIQLVRNLILLNPDNFVVRMIDPEGACQEGVYYGPVMLHHLIPMMHALQRWDGVNYFQQEPFKSRLQKVSSWFCQEVLPAPRDPLSGGSMDIGRYFNAINDSYTGFYNSGGLLSGLLLLGGAYQDPLATWVFKNTVQNVGNMLLPGSETYEYWQRHSHSHTLVESIVLYNDMVPPDPGTLLPKSKYYKERGLAYIHTSNTWADQNDIQFSLTASPAINPTTGIFSVKHDQPEKNSFTVSAYGEDFIIDIGYPGKWPEDQNCIFIDNKGEAIATDIVNGVESGASIPESNGNIVSFYSSPSFDFVHGDAKTAYNQLYGNRWIRRRAHLFPPE